MTIRSGKALNSTRKSTLVNTESSNLDSVNCTNCSSFGSSRRRTFSEQAWTVLLLWNEIDISVVDQAICNTCYQELRDILIDRSEEIEETETQGPENDQVRKQLNKRAG